MWASHTSLVNNEEGLHDRQPTRMTPGEVGYHYIQVPNLCVFVLVPFFKTNHLININNLSHLFNATEQTWLDYLSFIKGQRRRRIHQGEASLTYLYIKRLLVQEDKVTTEYWSWSNHNNLFFIFFLLFFSMEGLMGLLRIRVKRGINLAIRDVRTSDPYVIIRMGKQVLLSGYFRVAL